VSIGAQGIGEHIGVEPNVFIAGRAIAAAERFDLTSWDHDDPQPSGQQRLDDRAVGSLDRDLAHAEPDQAAGQPAQLAAGVGDVEAGSDLAVGVQHAHRVLPRRPIQPGHPRRCGSIHGDPFSAGGTQREGANAPPVRDAVAGGSLIGAR
jgi:hypothetical protein